MTTKRGMKGMFDMKHNPLPHPSPPWTTPAACEPRSLTWRRATPDNKSFLRTFRQPTIMVSAGSIHRHIRRGLIIASLQVPPLYHGSGWATAVRRASFFFFPIFFSLRVLSHTVFLIIVPAAFLFLSLYLSLSFFFLLFHHFLCLCSFPSHCFFSSKDLMGC